MKRKDYPINIKRLDEKQSVNSAYITRVFSTLIKLRDLKRSGESFDYNRELIKLFYMAQHLDANQELLDSLVSIIQNRIAIIVKDRIDMVNDIESNV